MALFSRRTPDPAKRDAAAEPSGAPEQADATAETSAEAPVDQPAEAVPHVGISISTFGAGRESARPLPDAEGAASAGPAASAAAAPGTAAPAATGAEPGAPAAPRRGPATAPAPTQTVAGMPDNVVVQAALAALPAQPQSADIMNVMRQTLQGRLYARAQGDAQAQLADGKGVNLAITTYQDKRFLLVFTGGAALQASARAESAATTSVIGQDAQNLFRTAISSGYDGVYLDHATEGARLILPIALVEKALDEGEPTFAIKSLLVAERGDATPLAVAEALTRVTVWAAGGTDPSGRVGLAEARGVDGSRRIELYSHPLEVIAMGRGDRPLPITPIQLGAMLTAETGLTGVVIDPAGPWIELDRDVLAPVLALAPEPTD